MEPVVEVFYAVWYGLFHLFLILFVCPPNYLDGSEAAEFLFYEFIVSLYVISTSQFGDRGLLKAYINNVQQYIRYLIVF